MAQANGHGERPRRAAKADGQSKRPGQKAGAKGQGQTLFFRGFVSGFFVLVPCLCTGKKGVKKWYAFCFHTIRYGNKKRAVFLREKSREKSEEQARLCIV
jgi:hypothetical protein